MKTKQEQLRAKLDEAEALQAKMEADEAERTEENTKAFDALVVEVETLQAGIVKDAKITGAKAFLEEPVTAPKSVPNGFQAARVEPTHPEVKSIGEMFVKDTAYQSMIGKSRGPNTRVVVEAKMMPSQMKATFDLAATGLQTYIGYQAGPILVEQQRLTVRDLLAVGQTTLNSVPYIQETSYTNAATTVAEEGEKPEATFALQDEFAPVKKIAVMARVTDEMWNDFPMLRDYINNRLRFMVQEREEAQLLSGAGTGSEITGILTASILSQATGADTVADAIHKAITKVRVEGRFEPDGIVIHPTDWQAIRLAKDDNNQYYAGGPFMGPYGNGGIAGETLWGKRVVVTTAITENTALVGAFKLGAQIWDREGITVEATNSHEDDFQYNRMAIRVEERLALAIYRLNAFCKVTGV